jgi:hypothetical protein
MKSIFSTIAIVFVSALISGCAAPTKRLDTPSGRPEIVIPGATAKSIIDTVAGMKLGEGFRVLTVNDYTLVIAKDIDDSTARLIYGSNYNRTPEARITYNFVGIGNGTKVFIRSEMVTNPRSPYEELTDFTQTWGKDAQAQLEQLKQKLQK